MKQGSANVTYVHQDHLTGTSVMSDSNGASLGSISYAAFGSARSGSVPTDKLFTGQRLDGTGLYYYGARYYDPEIGRFISPDSIVQSYANPQSLNRYSYVLNNPLKYVDPSGHIVFDLEDIMETEEAGMPVSPEAYKAALAFEEFRNEEPEIAQMMEESETLFPLELDDSGDLYMQFQKVNFSESFALYGPLGHGAMWGSILAVWNKEVMIVSIRLSANIGLPISSSAVPGASINVGNERPRMIHLNVPDYPVWNTRGSVYREGEIAVSASRETQVTLTVNMGVWTNSSTPDEPNYHQLVNPSSWAYVIRK